MSYLVAKKVAERGCIALKTKGDKAIASLVSYLGLRTIDKGIEIFIVSDPETYGEYKPYSFVSSEIDFINRVFEMFEETETEQLFVSGSIFPHGSMPIIPEEAIKNAKSPDRTALRKEAEEYEEYLRNRAKNGEKF